MNYTPEQIAKIVLKVLKEVNTPNLSHQEKLELAKHPNTPVETLKVLATDEIITVRYWVAKHPNTPVETLNVLATDKECDVRFGVTQNPNYKIKNLELTSIQYDALKTLLISSQVETLKNLTL